MVRPGTFEEIMRRSSTFVDDYTMSLQFPACDWSGYFLFAPIEGEGPCQSVNLGVCIGLAKGAEHNVPQWTGDPDRLFVITSVIWVTASATACSTTFPTLGGTSSTPGRASTSRSPRSPRARRVAVLRALLPRQ
jgi:hypothetical protein